MAFPTLFPDVIGDPTNTTTMWDVTLGDKVKHLIKFAENINGECMGVQICASSTICLLGI